MGLSLSFAMKERKSMKKLSPARYRALLMIGAFALALAGLQSAHCQSKKRPAYPAAQVVTTVDSYHGTNVPDPYRWLESADSPETTTWVKSENELTEAFLNQDPDRGRIRDALTSLWNYPRYTPPTREGGWYFSFKNNGLQNHYVLYRHKDPKEEGTPVLDPNAFSADGSISLAGWAISKDGRYLAYGMSKSGSDWQDIRIRDMETGRDYDEVLQWCRGGGFSWKPDGSGFYYARYPQPGTVAKGDETRYNRVYFHLLNTPQSRDALIYERPDDKELSFSPFVTDDGNYLILFVYRGTDRRNRIYCRPVESNGPFTRLLDKADAHYSFINNAGDLFYVETDLGASHGRIFAIDVKRPARECWKEILSEQRDTMSHAEMVNNRLVVCYLHDASHLLRLYDLKGAPSGEISLPCLGTVSSLTGKREDKRLFFAFTSFLYPTTIFQYDCAARSLTALRPPALKFDLSKYMTRELFYTSKDGTKVPLFITCRRDLPRQGKNPTILYGYGGFSYTMTPYFSPANIIWLEQGGIYAVACIRGGGEYGDLWHQAGLGKHKQQCFDDFIAAAEFLKKENFTCTSRLAINGASNGGLLVAACMVQRPDLFGAVICEVPLTDMLRYHKFTIGYFWVSEYGNAEKSASEFRTLYAYSPLHNIRKGAIYPPTMVLTADHDDRVVASHAKKFVAALQAADGGMNPLLLRLETKAGHGAGKPTAKQIEERADVYAFLFEVFGMKFQKKT
jgi:prolyl oligopeptidase